MTADPTSARDNLFPIPEDGDVQNGYDNQSECSDCVYCDQ